MTILIRQSRRRLAAHAVLAIAAAVWPACTAVSAHAQVIIEETTPTPPGGTAPKPHRTYHRRKPAPPKPPVNAFVAPKLLWRTLLHRCDGAPAVDGDTVFTTAGSDVCLLDSSGHTLAMTEIGPTQGTPLVDPNRVYVGTDHGSVFGLDRHSVKMLWKFSGAGDSILTAPASGAGRIYVESSDNAVYGLAASTGGQIWKFVRPDGSLGYAAPVYVPADTMTVTTNPTTQQSTFTGGADALVVCGDAAVYRLDPANGHQTWHTPVGGKSLSTPAVGGGRVYVGGDGPGVTALALSDGHQVWVFAGKSDHDWFGAPLLADSTIYVATHNRYVYALDAATGNPRWSTRLMTPGSTAPALDAKRHVLYLTTTTFGDNATLTALDSRNGTKLWETKIGPINGSPAISGDHLYVGTTSGYFYCFGLK